MSPQLSAGWLEATKLVTAKVAPPRPVASISMTELWNYQTSSGQRLARTEMLEIMTQETVLYL